MFDLTPFDRRNNRHHLSAYNPFKEMEDFSREFFGSTGLAQFNTDIRDEGKNLVLEADLPGFKKEDIHVDVDGNYLTINAQRHGESEEKDRSGNYLRQERSYGSFSRSFDISGIRADEIKVCYKDGVLRLQLPKKDETVSTSRRLEIE